MEMEQMNTALYKKMFAEQEKFRDWLVTLPPEEILHHAYEYIVREDILMAHENNNLTATQAAALFESREPLADIFRKYEHTESDYMETIWNCIEERADELLRNLRETPLYLQSATYAAEHGEREDYRASRKANIACRDAIEKAISANYSNNHLNTEAIYKSVHDQFGSERMKYVLAATVQYKDWDGRFSSENKAWAKSAFVSDIERDRIHEFTVNQAHPVLVDALVTRTRKEFAKEQEQQKPSVLDKLQKPAEPAKALVKKLKEHSL